MQRTTYPVVKLSWQAPQLCVYGSLALLTSAGSMGELEFYGCGDPRATAKKKTSRC
jgi:hypothetical protein